MKARILVIATAAALASGGVASAQVLPGTPVVPNVPVPATTVPPPTGQVSGSVSGQASGTVRTPDARDVVGATRERLDDARRTGEAAARDVITNAPRAASVDANANVRAQARVSRDRTAVNAAIEGGAEVRSSDGALLGTVAEISRNSTGRVTSFVVRSVDGAMRLVPAGNVGVQGSVLVTGWTESQFMARRARGSRQR